MVFFLNRVINVYKIINKMLLVYRYPLKIRFPENNVHTFHLSPNFSRDILKILLKFKMGLYIIPANVCI